MTLILRPACAAQTAAQLAFVIALGIADAVHQQDPALGETLALKWPNDILMDGRKAAGILLEQAVTGTQSAYVLVGCGVNVLTPPEGAACVPFPSVDAARDAILAAIDNRYQQWQAEGFVSIRHDWLKRAYGLGQGMRARMADKTITGVFDGLQADGTLCLLQADGTRVLITGAEIQFDAR